VRAPLDQSRDEIDAFVAEERIWIHQKLSQKASLNRKRPKREFVNGQGFLYLGKSYRLKLVDNEVPNPKRLRNGTPICLKYGYFELPEGEKQSARQHFVTWYTEKTEKKLKERIPRYDKRIGIQVERLRVSDLGHRWASYSRKGTISFNWRSVMAPIWVFDYILVHELAHMVERRHSKKFWRVVARIMPDYEEQVRWLNENGADLDL
jgi:predicted metal-dependent hydrolase